MRPYLIAINSSFCHTNLAVRYLSKRANCPYYETNENQREDIILKNIMELGADTLLFSCYIWNIHLVLRLASSIKKIDPSMTIILGGPEVSFDAKERMEQCPDIDAIFCGEGETLLPKLLELLEQGREPKLPGVVYKSAKAVVGDETYQVVEDLDTLPFPYDDYPANQIIYYEMSRGCPFSCTYCLSGAYGVRRLSTERIKEDLKKLSQAKVKVIKLVDRTFNADRAFVKEILPFILEETGDVRFHFEIGADLLDEELLELFARAPVNKFQLEAGVQSCNLATLALVKRKTDLGKLRHNIEFLLRAGNMHLHLDLIAGLPGETLDSFAQSFNFVYQLQPHMLQLGFLKLLRGSELRANAKEFGIVYREEPPYEVLLTKDISYRELNVLKGVEKMVERYYNSGRFCNALRFLVPHFSSPFSFYRNLSAFLKEEQDRPASAARQYDALIAFGSEHCKENFLQFLCFLKLDYLQSGAKGNLPKGFEKIQMNYSKREIRERFSLPGSAKFDLIPMHPEDGKPAAVLIAEEADPVTGQRALTFLPL